jgi:acyl-CoA thioesterase
VQHPQGRPQHEPGSLRRFPEQRARSVAHLSSFEVTSAVETISTKEDGGGGKYRAVVDPAWRVVKGAHGGYIAAIILKALTASVHDPERPIRSFTTHYLAAPTEGPLEIDVRVERTGRAMTSTSARVTQEGQTVALSLAAFSATRDGFAFDDTKMPEVGGPETGFQVPTKGEGIPAFLGNFDMRWLLGGPPLSGSDEAEVGGWFRLDPPAVADAPVVACLLDAWAPAIFPRATERVVCPTVDLTMHFRSPLPHPGATPDDFYLGRFWSRLSRDGFFEEDGELWAADGTLLAQSRQLALALKG